MQQPSNVPRHARVPAAEEQAFVFQSGERARSLVELADALGRAPASVVSFHRDHFAAWLTNVVGDEPLARRFTYYARAAPEPDVLRETLRDLVAARLRELPA